MKTKYRGNVKNFIDMDYLSILNTEDRKWMEEFVEEFYNGSHLKKESIHRKSFSGDKLSEVLKDTTLSHNGRNRCIQAIGDGTKYQLDLEKVDDFATERVVDINELLLSESLERILINLINETADSIDNSDDESTLKKLTEYTLKIGSIFSEVRSAERRAKNIAKVEKANERKAKRRETRVEKNNIEKESCSAI